MFWKEEKMKKVILILVCYLATLSQAVPITLYPSEDSMLSSHSNRGGGTVPQGSSGSLYTISKYSMLPSPGNYTLPIIKWDLNSFAGRTVLGSNVSVSLYLHDGWYYDRSHKYGTGIPNMDLTIHKALVSWNEASVTYNNFGGDVGIQSDEYAATGYSVRLQDQQIGWITWTIPASIVQQWIDNPSTNYGLIFMPEGNNRPEFDFFSRESGIPPRITFELNEVPEPATLSLFMLGFLTLKKYCKK